jgi:hypothetical protein
MGKGDVWTEWDNERLKAFVEKGASVFRAAAALRRKSHSVREQARRLGTPFPSIRDLRRKLRGSDLPQIRN